jgi:hypothetical protein
MDAFHGKQKKLPIYTLQVFPGTIQIIQNKCCRYSQEKKETHTNPLGRHSLNKTQNKQKIHGVRIAWKTPNVRCMPWKNKQSIQNTHCGSTSKKIVVLLESESVKQLIYI